MRGFAGFIIFLSALAANAQEISPSESVVTEGFVLECVDGFDQLEALNLVELGTTKKKRDRWKVKIDENCECATLFGDFASRVRLLRLPEFEKPYQIAISSIVKPRKKVAGESLVFSPAILLLDDQFETTRSYDSDSFRYRGGKLNRTIFINERNRLDRYLLVYTSHDDVGKSEARIAGGVNTAIVPIGVGVVAFVSGSDRRTSLTNTATGQLHIAIVDSDNKK